MSEVWKDVVGYEGMYEVSDLGRVRSVNRMVRTNGGGMILRKGKVASRKVDHKGAGYLYTSLSRGGVVKKVNVHTLVLEAFVGPRPSGHQACHADGDRTNANLQNLRWDTVRSNHADKLKHGTALRGELAPRAKLTKEQAIQVLADPRSSKIVARQLGVAGSTVRAIRTRANWAVLHE